MERDDHSEPHALRGATDRSALLTIRDTIREMEPLATAKLDDYLNPSILTVDLDDGLCTATEARIDIEWTTREDYKFHYTDIEGVNVRWGCHPHSGDYVDVSELAHFHPPPDASSDPRSVETSCITQASPEMVTRAVLKLWRVAYHRDAYEALNAGSNPP